MPEIIRFHLDENASNAIAESLRRRGIDVTTTPSAGLMGCSDIAPPPKHLKMRSPSPILQASPLTIPDNQKRSHPTKTPQKAIAPLPSHSDRTPPKHPKKRSLLSHPTAIAFPLLLLSAGEGLDLQCNRSIMRNE